MTAMMTTDEVLLVSKVRQALRAGTAAEARVAAGLSQSEIAATVGVSPSAVCKWEAGDRLPRGAVAQRYARLLDALSKAAA